MDPAGGRDIALVIIALLYSIVTFVVLMIFGTIWYFSGRGFGAVDRLLEQKVRPALDKAEQQLLAVRDQTARLPGNQSIGAADQPAKKKRRGLPISLPFRKKRRRFPFLPS